MLFRFLILSFICASLCATTGCNQTTHGQMIAAQENYNRLYQDTASLEQRYAKVDTDNQKLHTLVAQSNQETQLLEDKVSALEQQLKSSANQIAKLRQEKDTAKHKLASIEKNRTVTQPLTPSIRANNSLRGQLPVFDIKEINVRHDLDVVRIEIPERLLFQPGTTRLSSTASNVVRQVGEELARMYPDQKIGIEGHTDSTPVGANPSLPQNHHLSVGQATAIYDYLASGSRIRPAQLFIVGHGGNNPVYSNTTAQARVQNRRIEIVVYPETVR